MKRLSIKYTIVTSVMMLWGVFLVPSFALASTFAVGTSRTPSGDTISSPVSWTFSINSADSGVICVELAAYSYPDGNWNYIGQAAINDPNTPQTFTIGGALPTGEYKYVQISGDSNVDDCNAGNGFGTVYGNDADGGVGDFPNPNIEDSGGALSFTIKGGSGGGLSISTSSMTSLTIGAVGDLGAFSWQVIGKIILLIEVLLIIGLGLVLIRRYIYNEGYSAGIGWYDKKVRDEFEKWDRGNK
jgi:hypothetical protein